MQIFEGKNRIIVGCLAIFGLLLFGLVIGVGVGIIIKSQSAGNILALDAPPTNTITPRKTPTEIYHSNITYVVDWTPTYTRTPYPTTTPHPTNTSAPSPTPIVYTGSGDSIIDINKGPQPALVHIIGNASSRFFAVTNLDVNNEMIDLLVNTTEPYDGIRPLDFMENEKTARFEIQADGAWTIEILSILIMEQVWVPGEISGSGDYVFSLVGKPPDTADITGNLDSRFFAIIGYDGGSDLLVNTTDPYQGTVLLDSETFIIEVDAIGDWTIKINSH